ncbi:terpene synthase family protein [Plantactinospora sp. KLBMP9567]|uniref:terpene synthase family protein n=1 Tax=Plantactinospora sp. KLBMP9567 TaxID=3085900 RepID=UPI002981BD90|nr:terpene synthase [Plantactinospora sp. KLBMP9567]MDW5329101.1 terpene synthase [Plantactinospora sp. KLBMP9567]MDW5329995.1 terpene synthase [Plantactinospora sp. KLBMP9567]
MYGISSWAAELSCPIPARLCPHADAVQEWLVDWADLIIGPLDATARDRLTRSGVARYAGRLYPDASEADLRVIAALFTWFFLLDDACDATRRPRPAEVSALCDGVLRLLRSTPAGPPPPGSPPRAGQPTPAVTPGRPSPAAGPGPWTGHPSAAQSRPAHHPAAGTGARSTNQPAARLTTPPQSRAANKPAARPEAFDGPLRRMLADAWRTPYQRMSAAWRDRFVDAVAHHLVGVVTEATNKASGRLPGVAEYIPLRRATSAAYVSYALIEFATGQPVPDAIYHHPVVRKVADTANDLLSWFNDLLSLERDAATSGGHNLVLAVAREEGIPVEAAIEAVVRRWQRSMRRFVELRDAVPSFGPAMDRPLREYLDGLGNSVRGTMDWSMESARYRDVVAAPRPAGPLGQAEPRRRPDRPPNGIGARAEPSG